MKAYIIEILKSKFVNIPMNLTNLSRVADVRFLYIFIM